MQDIIAISKTTINGAEENSVNSRDIYEYLEVETAYTTWFNRAVEKYDFAEDEDFIPFMKESNGGRPSTDYIVTMDMAKELCMVSNTTKGKETRKYFIKVERESHKPMTQIEILAAQGQILLEQDKRIEQMEHVQVKTLAAIEKVQDDVVEVISSFEFSTPEIEPSKNYAPIGFFHKEYGIAEGVLKTVAERKDVRVEQCEKHIEKKRNNSKYIAYNKSDMKESVILMMENAVGVSKTLYSVEGVNKKFQVNNPWFAKLCRRPFRPFGKKSRLF